MNQDGSEMRHEFARSVVHTEVTMKNTTLWDVTPCSLAEVYKYFGGMYRLHFLGQRVSK
jgi:hypothetical protein